MNKMEFQDFGSKNLFLVGVSHWNSSVNVREKFSLTKEQMIRLFEVAKSAGINSVFSISTCNRTEVYALAENAELVMELFIQATIFTQPVTFNPQLATQDLTNHIYTKQGQKTAEHLFKVSAGLDAQILGDAQITGQIREFHQLALQHNSLDATLNRLIETAISVGKEVKAQTQLNSGAATVAHAAVRFAVKQKQNDFSALVVGSGKTGKLVLKNLLKFISSDNISLVNRTNETSFQLAKEHAVQAYKFDSLKSQIEKSDVIFTATAAQQILITNELLQGINLSNKLFIDLSMPRNIESDLNATIIDIDELTDSDTQQRKNYAVIAEKIIEAGITEFLEWLHRYELAQTLKSHIAESIFDNSLEEDEIIAPSKFIDGITSRHLRHFQKGKQSRNLAA